MENQFHIGFTNFTVSTSATTVKFVEITHTKDQKHFNVTLVNGVMLMV